MDGNPGNIVREIVCNLAGGRYIDTLIMGAAYYRTDVVYDVGDHVVIHAAIVVVGDDATCTLNAPCHFLCNVMNEIVLDHVIRTGSVDSARPQHSALRVRPIDLKPVDRDVAPAVVPGDGRRRIRRRDDL